MLVKNDGLIESQILSLSYGRVLVKPMEKQRGLVPDSYESYQILDPLRVRKEIMDPQFLVYQVYAGLPRRRISLATQGSTVGHFNMDDMGWMRVAVSDIEVQRQFVSKIEYANSDANEAIDKTQSEIALLQEFRTRLVAEVVTGQVDVRAIAATLPEALEDVAELAADSDDECGDPQEQGL